MYAHNTTGIHLYSVRLLFFGQKVSLSFSPFYNVAVATRAHLHSSQKQEDFSTFSLIVHWKTESEKSQCKGFVQ